MIWFRLLWTILKMALRLFAQSWGHQRYAGDVQCNWRGYRLRMKLTASSLTVPVPRPTPPLTHEEDAVLIPADLVDRGNQLLP